MLQGQLLKVTQAPRRLEAGIDPDLVFKIKTTGRPTDSSLDQAAVQLLGETVDYTYFVLCQDAGQGLATVLRDYTTSESNKTLVSSIEHLEPYGPEDRQGPGLDFLDTGEDPGLDSAGRIRVDILIWPAGNISEARRRGSIVETVLQGNAAVVELRSVSARRNVIRASLPVDGLLDLLDTSVVEQVRTPPVPYLDFRDWRTLAADEITRTDVASAVVGILDDAPATGHPLLTGLILSVDHIAPRSYPWQQPGHHGSEVAGRALLPHLHEQLRDGHPITAHGTVRVARILEPDPHAPNRTRFVESGFVHDVIEEAIRHLHDKYGVKVFNISAGFDQPHTALHLDPLTEVVDELVRELDIVVVLPTGNVGTTLHGQTPSGHHVVADYPAYLESAEHRLASPAPAALAVTVGSIALSEAVAEIHGQNRLGWQAVAPVDGVSPFSRTGPGIGTREGRHNKPDLVHYGGNVALNDVGQVVPNDPGTALVSTAFDLSSGRLFTACRGTSYAAPAVARVAADIAHAYPTASANLIRALLASSAHLPRPAVEVPDKDVRARRYGRGLPDTVRATSSGGKRATLIYDGETSVDDVHIHSLTLPEPFRLGSGGERNVKIALAFDPPVRRQRREYLAGQMQVDLYRNISLEELEEILRRQQSQRPLDMIKDSRRLSLDPGSNSCLGSTLQVRQWTARHSFVDDAETFYVAVTHRSATWARDDPSYSTQSYGIAVTLEDRGRAQVDLRQLLIQQARIRLRS